MKKAAALFFALIIFIVSLPSCSSVDDPSCREIVGELTKAEIGLPAGRFYTLSADKGDPEYASKSLISSLFGGGRYPKLAEGWIDLALFLSTGSHPCEFAVILCRDRDVAHDTATLLLSRLSTVKLTKADSKYADMLQTASVTIVGNYAILLISRDAKHALKVAKAAMK